MCETVYQLTRSGDGVEYLVEPFLDNAFMQRALVAGVLVALACAVMGTFVVLRGLAFIGRFAVIGLSDRRENRTFQDLALEENLRQRDTETRCGLWVVDLESFDAPHWVRFGGIVKELYDVGVLPGIRRPMAVGFKTDEVRRYLSFPQDG